MIILTDGIPIHFLKMIEMFYSRVLGIARCVGVLGEGTGMRDEFILLFVSLILLMNLWIACQLLNWDCESFFAIFCIYPLA